MDSLLSSLTSSGGGCVTTTGTSCTTEGCSSSSSSSLDVGGCSTTVTDATGIGFFSCSSPSVSDVEGGEVGLAAVFAPGTPTMPDRAAAEEDAEDEAEDLRRPADSTDSCLACSFFSSSAAFSRFSWKRYKKR